MGKMLFSFSRVKSTVRAATEASIARNLIPQRSTDELLELKAKQSKWILRQCSSLCDCYGKAVISKGSWLSVRIVYLFS